MLFSCVIHGFHGSRQNKVCTVGGNLAGGCNMATHIDWLAPHVSHPALLRLLAFGAIAGIAAGGLLAR
jgi:hypothetical protein